jgi:hypothetical protein
MKPGSGAAGGFPKGRRWAVPPRKFLVKPWQGEFVVVSPEGEYVGEAMPNRRLALELCERIQEAADKKAQRKIRPCLCCRTDFQSEGVHNRLCGKCRHGADPLDPVRPYIERRSA